MANSSDRHGYSPLSAACQKGHDEIVYSLLENGSNEDFCNSYVVCPLSEASRKGQLSNMLLLLKKGAKEIIGAIYGYNPIGYTCECGKEYLVLPMMIVKDSSLKR